MDILSKIKESVAQELGYKSNSVLTAYEQLIINPHGLTYKVLEEAIDKVAKRYAKEVAREALKNASESATTTQGYCSDGWTPSVKVVDKQSILNESNLPEI